MLFRMAVLLYNFAGNSWVFVAPGYLEEIFGPAGGEGWGCLICVLWGGCLFRRKKEGRKERKSTLLSVITGTKQPLSSPGADDQSEGLTRDLSNHRFPTTLI